LDVLADQKTLKFAIN